MFQMKIVGFNLIKLLVKLSLRTEENSETGGEPPSLGYAGARDSKLRF